MPQKSIISFILLIGVVCIVLILVNLYLVQPRLALKLEAPEPLPTIEQMPSPPPGIQVETTMDLIKKMASGKEQMQETFVPRQILRNPFLDSAALVKKDAPASGAEKGAEGDAEFMPQVQMVMIGEYQKSALLDGVLVTEGEFYNGYRVEQIIEAGVRLRGSGKTLMVPLGVYTSTASSRPVENRDIKKDKKNGAVPVKQKAALGDLLRRLEPLLKTDEKSAEK